MNIEASSDETSSAPLRKLWPELVTGLAVAGFFAWTVLPGLHWYDGGEFGAVAEQLSISHAPGHPLHALTTAFGLRFFAGDLAWRANLSSALAFVFACVLFCRLLREMLPQASKWGAILTACLPAVMPALFVQGIRCEVYALQMLMSVACALLCWRFFATGDRRFFWAVGFCFGLAGCNHTYIALTLMPLPLLCLVFRWPGLKTVGQGALFGLLGLLIYFYLPLRANAGGEIGWGSPQTLKEMLWHISALEWLKNPAISYGGLSEPDDIIHYVLDQLGPISALIALCFATLACIASLPMWDELGERRAPCLAALLVGLVGCLCNRARIDHLNPDIGGYMATALLALLVLIWVGASMLPKLQWLPLLIALCCMCTRFDPYHRQNARTAEAFAQQMLREIPPQGALLSSDYQTYFLTTALRCFEGARPDAALIFRGQMHHPGFLKRLESQSPEWAARIAGFPESFRGHLVAVEPGVMLDQLGDLQLELNPFGLTLQLGSELQGDVIQQVAQRFNRVSVGKESDLDAQKALAFLHTQHLEYWFNVRHQRRLAWSHVRRAADLAPNDPYILDIANKLTPPTERPQMRPVSP